MLSTSHCAEAALDFLASPGEMAGDGDAREFRPLRSAQKPRGDSVVAKEMLGNGDGNRCPLSRQAQKLRGAFVVLTGVEQGDGDGAGDGREYRLLRPAQKPRGDFVVAKEIPGDDDGHMCWLPRPAQKQCGTSWCRRVRCQVTATTESIGRRALHRSCVGVWSSSRRCRSTATAIDVGRLSPHRNRAGTSWHRQGDAGRRRRQYVLAASPRAEATWEFLASPGEMPGNGNGQEYRPPCPAEKPHGDFVVTKEMSGDGDGHRCWPPCPAQKQRGTSWCCRARCQATATIESIGPPCPAKKPGGDFVVA